MEAFSPVNGFLHDGSDAAAWLRPVAGQARRGSADLVVRLDPGRGSNGDGSHSWSTGEIDPDAADAGLASDGSPDAAG